MGNKCSKEAPQQVYSGSTTSPAPSTNINHQKPTAAAVVAKEQAQSSSANPAATVKAQHANTNNCSNASLLEALQTVTRHLNEYTYEKQLSTEELKASLSVYNELQRVLTVATRTGDMMARPSDFRHDSDFKTTFDALVKEFDAAEEEQQKILHSNPAAVRPLSLEALQQVNKDFFILDNSLRETTVGAPRGHTLEEKHKIVDAIADTGLQEIILGSFGSKIAVDSQIAERWRELGRDFDSTWGFSDAYDLEGYSEEELWQSVPDFVAKESAHSGTGGDFYTPPANPKHKYSKDDVELFQSACKGFQKGAYPPGVKAKTILKRNESKQGRLPLGLLMMKGYGISNAIVEVDTSVETFDYDRYDIVERCKFLIEWCKENLPKRQNVPEGEDNTSRVLINLRDFSNFQRSQGGAEEALRLVDALCRLPPHQRPFGFIMEEPTGWLLPHEIGRLVRMVRLTMQRAGFPEGRFLVHIHWYFGMAEASQLACLANGADGVWAAVCKAGAQVGHACSTVTAVNLFKAGHHEIAKKYDLQKMCKAAREVTEISTRQPCPTHEEVYGELAFDIPYFMTNIPSCRYSLGMLMTKMGVETRRVRLNELSSVKSIHTAMVQWFGEPDATGWDSAFCSNMHDAIHNHLLTGLSRDYNSALGLGHLYALVSKKSLPTPMVAIMTEQSPISDYHPTVLDFISRWNRLCAQYEGDEIPLPPAARSNSHMMFAADITVKPRRETLPFDYFTADIMRNPVLEPVPRLFKLQVVSLLTSDERRLQERKVPIVNFYEMIVRLKLFIAEADSLGVLGIVDDFCIRKNHDYFFGEDNLWLQQVRGNRPKMVNKLLRKHMDFFPTVYAGQGNNAIMRCVKAAAKRIDINEGIKDDLRDLRRGSAKLAINKVLKSEEDSGHISTGSTNKQFTSAHEEILKALADDEGQDEELAAEYLKETKEILGLADAVDDIVDLGDIFVKEMKYKVGISGDGDSSSGVSELLEKVPSTRQLIRRGSEALMTLDPKLYKMVKDAEGFESDCDIVAEGDEDESESSASSSVGDLLPRAQLTRDVTC